MMGRFPPMAGPAACRGPVGGAGPIGDRQMRRTAALATPLLATAAALLLLTAGRASAQDEAAIRNSVVKIFTTARPPDLLRPWAKQNPREATGTGAVIAGNRILTNAHVVLYASQVFVQPDGSGDKLPATVEAIGPGIDLAVLKLEDESFFDDRKPIELAPTLPHVKDAVLVYGYPAGGTSQSITKGIVSRIEFAPFSGQTHALRIQIDAAINPGNSGGPALVDDKMIGLAFSRLNQADNIGYIIPTEEIDLFLADVKDGRYDGKPGMFDQLQTLENEALRARLGAGREVRGIVVHRPDTDDEGYPLKEWDILTKIGTHEIDSDGFARVDGDLRVRFQYFLQHEAKDGKVPMTLLRDGQPIKVMVPVANRRPTLIEELGGRYPSYFVYGPLVFGPATAELMATIERAQAQGVSLAAVFAALGSPLITRRGDKPAFDGEELVVVTAPMFPHRLGKGYSNPLFKVLKSVNGTPVKSLKHLVEFLRDCDAEFVEFAFDDRGSETIIFRRKDVEAAGDEILSDNGVRKPYSDDIAPVWDKAGAGR